MKKATTVFILLFFPVHCFCGYTVRLGKFVDEQWVTKKPIQEHYSSIMQHFEQKRWKNVVQEGLLILKNFPDTPFTQEIPYLVGVSYYELTDYELANWHFSNYLRSQVTPKHFEEAIQYKFAIAEQFREGSRKHLMGYKSMPKWASASADALSIYDEVISAMPQDELAAKSLYAKGQIHLRNKEFRSSIEAYQTLIRRFPKNPLAAESYIGIAEVYLKRGEFEYPDPDYLDLAAINLKKFRSSFPGEEKIAEAEKKFAEMQEVYAQSLWETARFFERTKKYKAAKIYYTKILASYPETKIATQSQKRLEGVEQRLQKIEAKAKT